MFLNLYRTLVNIALKILIKRKIIVKSFWTFNINLYLILIHYYLKIHRRCKIQPILFAFIID